MAHKNPLISVAIPAYKTKFLSEAIQSVLNQSYAHFELIIVNDASPEDVSSIVKMFVDKRIKYFENKENLGRNDPTRNWNKCFEYVRGELFVLFADDDVYHRNFLQELYLLSEKYPQINLFHSRVEQIDEKGNTLQLSPICPEIEHPLDFIWHRIRGYRLQFAADFMCRSEALRKIGGFFPMPLSWCADDITWFQLSQPHGIGYTAAPLCKFRVSEEQISSSGGLKKKLAAIGQYTTWLNSFTKSYNTTSKYEQILLDMIRNELIIMHKRKEQYEIIHNLRNTNILSAIWSLLLLKNVHHSKLQTFVKFIAHKYRVRNH